MKARKPNQAILAAVRKRILMHHGGEQLLLHEGKIAEEFGVSRTPIRQIFQSLAANWMIEVRSGVGSVATPLLVKNRRKEMRAFSAILRACADCAASQNTSDAKLEFQALKARFDATHEMASDEFFECSDRLITSLMEMVEDPIVSSSLSACFWRFVRWRIADHDAQFSSVSAELSKIASDIELGLEAEGAPRAFTLFAMTVDGLAV